MAIRTKNFDHRRYPHPNMTGAIIHAARSSSSQYFTGAVTVAGELTLLNNTGLGTPCSVSLVSTDGSGTAFAGTVEVTGENQFGEPISEVLTVPAGETTQYTASPYQRVDRVEVLTVTAGAGANSVVVGQLRSSNVNYALPFRVKENLLREKGAGHEDAEIWSVVDGLTGAISSQVYTVHPEVNAISSDGVPQTVLFVRVNFRSGKNV